MTWNEYTGAGLTDGIWWDHGANFFQDGEAVWIYPPAQNAVTFDLGSDQPLGEVRVHSLFRPGNCSPPENIVVLVSANNVRYFYTAEMPHRDAVFTKSLHFNAKADSAAAAVSNYFTVAYDANRLNTHGRYVKFVLMASPTNSVRMWIEEIEIFRGDPAFSGTPLGGAGIVGNGPQLSAGIGWQRRLALDSSLLAARAARAGLDLASPLQSISNRRRAFTDHYRELAHLKTYFPLDPIDPGGHESLGKIQRDLIRLNAAILRKQGCTGLVAWRSNSPWDPLDAYSEPASGRPPRSIDLAMMNGERRAAAVNLSNAADSEATVSLNIDGFAAATRNPDWINVFAVRGTDTQQNVLQSDLFGALAAEPGRLHRAHSRRHDPATLAEAGPLVAAAGKEGRRDAAHRRRRSVRGCPREVGHLGPSVPFPTHALVRGSVDRGD